MKPAILLLLAVWLTGCEYTVPLVTGPGLAVDRELPGIWSGQDPENPGRRLRILPLGATEYLVEFPADTADAMFARASVVRLAGMEIAQLRWFGTSRGELPEDGRVYQFARVERTGDRLTLRFLSSDVVPRDIATPAALKAAIEAAADRADLFREGQVFRRLSRATGWIPES